MAFNLDGGDDCDWSLKVFSTNPQLLSYLRAHFNVWLKEEQEKHQNLDGEVLYGFGFNGIFQKGVVKGIYIVFEDEYGGTKSMKDEGLVSKVVKTVYSPLFRIKN